MQRSQRQALNAAKSQIHAAFHNIKGIPTNLKWIQSTQIGGLFLFITSRHFNALKIATVHFQGVY